MTLTPEERAATNRRNASKSTGPRTEQGKAASRRNATKHGLRAEALALPNEDPAAVAARTESWNDYYRPQSPAAQHLVNACVAATLLSDRCQQYHAAAISRQVREAESAWDAGREDAVASAVALLPADPVTAVRRLNRTGHGCRWLAARWEALIAALDERGWWTTPERDDALHLQGLHERGDRLRTDPEAWLQVLYATACLDEPAPAFLDWLFHPTRVPELYDGAFAPDALPPRDVCRRGLRDLAATELAAARAREAAHRAGSDEPDRAGAADRALVLHDGPSARLFLRYHAEARTAFHRAYGSLVQTLERDAAGDADDPALAPIEADCPPADPVSPNEAIPEPPGGPEPEADVDPAWSDTDRANYDLILEALGGPTRTAAEPRDHAPKAAARPRRVG